MKKLAVFFALLCVPAVSGRPQVLANSARSKRRELQEVQKQLEQKKREISEYQRQADGAKKDLSKLASESSASKRAIRSLEDKIHVAERKKAELKTKLSALELAENQWQGVIADELRDLYRLRLGEFEFFSSVDVVAESFRRAAILEKMSYVRGLHGYQEKTAQAEAEAQLQKKALEAKSSVVKAKQQDTQSRYLKKKEAYLETQQKLSETSKAVQELQNSALALTHLVRMLEKKSVYKTDSPVPLAERPHSLPWPAEGKLVQGFGKQQVPELHTWVVQHGIRLATAAQAPVRCVKTGKVIFTGPFRSYGKVIIVDHGGAFYSIYGMLGELLVKKGDRVGASQFLATAGAADEGGSLYFEIRQSGDALDPTQWLKSKE